MPEEERLLPFGTAFEVKDLKPLTEDLLMVAIKQTDVLALAPTNAGSEPEPEVDGRTFGQDVWGGQVDLPGAVPQP